MNLRKFPKQVALLFLALAFTQGCAQGSTRSADSGATRPRKTISVAAFGGLGVSGIPPGEVVHMTGYLQKLEACYCSPDATCEECLSWFNFTDEKPTQAELSPSARFERGSNVAFSGSPSFPSGYYLEGFYTGEIAPEEMDPPIRLGNKYILAITTFRAPDAEPHELSFKCLGYWLSD
jgi:hypothetical protein